MRRCIICTTDRDDVTLTRVVPGIWTDFNNFVGICADCQATERYKKLLKQKKIFPPSTPVEPKPEPAAVAEGEDEESEE